MRKLISLTKFKTKKPAYIAIEKIEIIEPYTNYSIIKITNNFIIVCETTDEIHEKLEKLTKWE